MKIIDDLLNGITMYRLMLYVLLFLVSVAIILSFFRLLPFDPISLFLSAAFLTLVCWVTNTIFAKLFKVPTNFESVYITALILTLILTPARTPHSFVFFFWVAVISQSSKYILAINKKHFFNPAAFAVALIGGASWWVGTIWMTPFVLVAGLLVVRKIRKFVLVFSFLFVALTLMPVSQKLILDTPILFFALVMLIEPLTTPPNKKLQVIYGGLVGIGFSQVTPEIALLVGNIFSYIVSPKEKLLLILKEKIQLTTDIYDFVFGLDKKLRFLPGQYMEWTLNNKPDSRGNRRYFTIASSPTEKNLHIGVKFYPDSSSFKRTLISLSPGDEIIAGQLSGEFILPEDVSKKLCFIAGGIGITPYRSIIKYLQDISQRRDIILLYSSKKESDFVYKDILNYVKTIYIVTEKGQFIDETMIKMQIPDFKDRIFYISGPHSMVDAFEKTLKEMGISNNQIKVDFFPGYA
ncbi:oxidoreductase [Candidatus Daviesbacteria bacterium]|nr:oxidoreductase [Candidatus Daviesbacteria bacterium]